MDKIAVIDLGGQYCHLLARRIRQLNVYSEILPSDVKSNTLKGFKGIILSGGPFSINDKGSQIDKNILGLGIPVLGLCYGHQLIAQYLGGKVKPGKTKEYGLAELEVKDKNGLFKGLNDLETIWMSHGDTVSALPSGFRIIGSTPDCPVAAMGSKTLFGLQFHPEVTHTPNGMKILENFVNICGCKREWSIKDYIGEKVSEIKDFVKERKVFLLVSGGVDSSVCFALLNKALGPERVYGLHIDNGLMRKNESIHVEAYLKKRGFHNFHVADYSSEFIGALRNAYEPEEKRKIIGRLFIKAYEAETKKLNLNPDEWMLAQGTIYPDTIETKGTKDADLIKTHHNRVDAVQELINKGKVIEPLAKLYKDEVRELGVKLGLSEELVYRHPFPGPGLGVRCLCSKDEIDEHALEDDILPVKSVGVQGDDRTYRHPMLLAKDGKIDWKKIEKKSTDITNRNHSVNRVVLLLYPDEVETVALKKAHITKERLELLRAADDIVMSTINRRKLYGEIWQFPVVLLPLSVNGGSGESVVLRPITSQEAMTARFAELPPDAIDEIVEKLKKLNGIDAVFYDVTHKPPGTIEWE